MMAAVLLPTISVSLKMAGFRRTLSWLARTAAGHGPDDAAAVLRDSEAAIARVRHRMPWAGRCLARSLTLWWILQRYGIAASLQIGVRMVDGRLEAHAWVVHNRRVVADAADIPLRYPGSFESAAGQLAFSNQSKPER